MASCEDVATPIPLENVMSAYTNPAEKVKSGSLPAVFDSPGSRDVTLYDPAKGLQLIAVAEAGEKHYRRAKDAVQLCAAIDAKIDAQADYIVWRDSVVLSPSNRGQGRQKNQIAAPKSVFPSADPGPVMAHRWRKSFTQRTGGVTVRDENKITMAKEAAKLAAIRFCELQQNARGTRGAGDDERYTPPEYIALACEVLGSIDLDPASHERAQRIVKAAEYYTREDDGLVHEWRGRVWLNPPYGQPLIAQFVEKMCAEWELGHVSAGIMLTHNYTDTEWFHQAVEVAAAICFTKGRVKFYQPDSRVAEPQQGQAFFYFGDDVERFTECFSTIGFVK